MDALCAAAADHVRPVIDRSFAFEQVHEALRYMAGGEKIGKVMIRVA